MSYFWDGLAGLLTGILSGWGIGGGSLLLLYMTLFAGVEQRKAQGINLVYFLPVSAGALPDHFKNGMVEKKVALFAIASGLVFSAGGAWLATMIDVGLLKKIFGGFLIFIGLKELFAKKK